MIGIKPPLTRERIALAHEHLWVIDAVLRRYRRFSTDREDAWQDGYFGLLRATADFDPGRGVKFGTYAFHWVHAGISHGLDAYEGSSFRRTRGGRGDEWHRPESLDAPRSDDDPTPIGWTIPEPSGQHDALDPPRVALVQAIHDECRDDLDRAIVHNLSNGIGAVAAVRDRDLHPSLASKRVARMRARIAARLDAAS